MSAELERRPVALGKPVLDLDGAYRLSKNLAVATVLPNALRGKASDVLAIVLYGQDLGMSPMQSIQGIYVVKGKPQLSSTTWLALARRAGHKVRFIEQTDDKCTVEIVRADDPEHPHRETYTLQDAITSNLVKLREGKPYARSPKGEPLPWETYTRTMIRNRAISNAAKAACPEVALGFAVEGDYDYVPNEPTEVSPPEHHGDVVDAEIVPEQVDAEIADLAAEYDFSQPQTQPDAPTVEELPAPPANYVCETCQAIGEHYEDECPKAAKP